MRLDASLEMIEKHLVSAYQRLVEAQPAGGPTGEAAP